MWNPYFRFISTQLRRYGKKSIVWLAVLQATWFLATPALAVMPTMYLYWTEDPMLDGLRIKNLPEDIASADLLCENLLREGLSHQMRTPGYDQDILPRPNGYFFPSREELSADRVLLAYSQGLFPMAQAEDGKIKWQEPAVRGVLDFSDFHVSRTILKVLRRGQFTVTFDKAFESVIRNCQKRKQGKRSVWLSDPIAEVWIDLAHLGYAHSVEVWNNEGNLVGGLYGTFVGGYYSGESMFSREANAGRVAFVYLIEHLKQNGHTWIDTQAVTEATRFFGAKEISRYEFLQRLAAAKRLELSY